MTSSSAARRVLPETTPALIDAALHEDLGDRGDVTTLLTVGGRGSTTHGRIVAKAEGRLSGVAVAEEVFARVDREVRVTLHARDGAPVVPGDLVLQVEGPAASLLEAERTALNFLGRLSGVATLTARFVAAVAGTRARIVDTRKTTPGFRLLEKQAVLDGGGKNHRIGLYDEVLLKENHFAMAPELGYEQLVRRVRAEAPAGMRITAEARDLDEAAACADGGADVILLDNFGVEGLRRAVTTLAGHPRRAAFELEASGGVNLSTVGEIAATGVDRISVGALTHSAPALDLSMLLDVAGAA
ncbi:MAG: carboxylating nicotinate-nucleotide diphosphorylase [Planctomycetes bacterium]|nr:carboxylating nicotinate-nucleotide diphosphorylase [Planctomycetota bacterium]